MSRQTALDNIDLRGDPAWAHTEYSLEYHPEYLAARTGVQPEDPDFRRLAFERFGFDFLWSTNDGLVEWGKAGRVTDMGHTSYASDGSDQRKPAESPFAEPEDVWAFDAVGEYGVYCCRGCNRRR